MGDCAMVVPVLLRFIQAYPQVKITVVTKAFFAPIFKTLPKSVSVVIADTNNKHKGFFGVLKLAKQLQNIEFDAVADLHNVLRSKIIRTKFSLSGMHNKAAINKGRAEKKALVRPKNKIFKPLKTTPERYADVFKNLGYPVDLKRKAQLQKPKLSDEIKKEIGGPEKKWIGLAPFAAHKPKTYPLDLMEKVLAELDKTNTFKLLLFGGGKQENKQLQNLASTYKNSVCVAGKWTFEEEINLVAH